MTARQGSWRRPAVMARALMSAGKRRGIDRSGDRPPEEVADRGDLEPGGRTRRRPFEGPFAIFSADAAGS